MSGSTWWVVSGVALLLGSCTPRKAAVDCRQASAACADGFECREQGGAWACQRVAQASAPSSGETAAKAPPAAIPAAAAPPAAAAQPLSEAEQEKLRSEASMNLRKLADSSVSYYNEEQADRTGRILPQQFPEGVSLTPRAPLACKQGRPVPFQSNYDSWDDPTWQSLNFGVDGSHYFRYAYESSGLGKDSTFRALAVGDLDCDGTPSTFEYAGRIDNSNNVTLDRLREIKPGDAAGKMIGRFTIDLERTMARDPKMRDLPPDQKQKAMAAAQAFLGNMSFEFTAEGRAIAKMGTKAEESTYVITGQDGNRLTLKMTSEKDDKRKVETVHVEVDGDRLTMSQDNQSFVLKRLP